LRCKRERKGGKRKKRKERKERKRERWKRAGKCAGTELVEAKGTTAARQKEEEKNTVSSMRIE
jgi:hypothetical protein